MVFACLFVAAPSGAFAQSSITEIVAKHSAKCVSVWGGSSANLARSVQWDCQGVDHQRYTFEPASGGGYFVVAKHSGKCLAVNGGSKANSATVVQWPCSNGNYGNDVWYPQAQLGGYRLVAKHSDKCMAVNYGQKSNNFDLVQWPCSVAASHTFDIELPTDPVVDPPPVIGQAGQLVSFASGKCASVWGGSNANSARLAQWECRGAPSQLFTLEPTSQADQFFVVAKHSGKCLAVNYGSSTNGEKIIQYTCSNGNYGNDVWQLMPTADGHQLRAKHSGKCMAVWGGAATNGADLVQWDCAASNNMLFEVGALSSGQGQWGPVTELPLIPAAGAVLSNGSVLLWSSYSKMAFGGDYGYTQTAIFNPLTGSVSESLINQTQHDMFCPGISTLADGRIMITGGSSAAKTSIFDSLSGTWQAGPTLNNPRAYHSSAVLANGSVMVIGGSWAGGVFDKGTEIYENGVWRKLTGASSIPMVGNDPAGLLRGDNHFWLFPWTNDRVFQAGPSAQMHWISTLDEGSVTPAGPRNQDRFSINGNAVMYAPGKILTVGGSTAYNFGRASAAAHIIDINGPAVTTRSIAPMKRARTYHNSVVLPSGEVVVIGGVGGSPITFVEAESVMAAELFDPVSETFTNLAPLRVPRTYHSFAVLLNDGRVLAGGGGLCGGCATNHANLEILTPPYLLNEDGSPASRPNIVSGPRTANYSDSISINTDSTVDEFVLVRMGAATHSVNTDQRRIPVTSQIFGNLNIVSMPSEAGIALPGEYYLFAMRNGVPSLAHMLRLQ